MVQYMVASKITMIKTKWAVTECFEYDDDQF